MLVSRVLGLNLIIPLLFLFLLENTFFIDLELGSKIRNIDSYMARQIYVNQRGIIIIESNILCVLHTLMSRNKHKLIIQWERVEFGRGWSDICDKSWILISHYTELGENSRISTNFSQFEIWHLFSNHSLYQKYG